jgi:hemolysin III
MLEKTAKFTLIEEVLNSITHGIGILISIAGLVIMIVFSSLYGNAMHIVSSAVFGLTLVFLYTASTLYHSSRSTELKHIFRIIDHSCIYALIAGTYTPFTLVILQGALGWTIFTVVWSLTIFGIIFKVFFTNRFNIISTLTYILMGWIIIFAIKSLLQALPAVAIAWIVAGGIVYTLGTIFYIWNKFPFNHAIWHFFVLAGSFCHFYAVMLHVIPLNN